MFRNNRYYYLSGAVGLTFGLLAAFLILGVNAESRATIVDVLTQAEARKAGIQKFLRLMVDSETAQRGFLLTNDPEYLKPYELARHDTGQLLDELSNSYLAEDLLTSNAAVRKDLRQLRELSASRMNEIAATLALYATKSPDAAFALVRTNLGKTTMDELRAIAGKIEKREDDRIARAVMDWKAGVLWSRVILLGGTLLNVALIIGAVALVNRDLRRREESARRLETYSDELENQVKRRTAALSELSSHLQHLAEREKAAIARELHDELGGLMIAAKMDVSWLEKRLGSPDNEIKLRWSRVRKLLDDGLNMKRRVVETLRPTLLDNMGLVPAVKWIYQETCARAGLQCTERYPVDELRLRDEAAIAVFRVVQESMTNIVKHAKATTVDLAMWIEDRALKIEVRDDGVGIPEVAKSVGGHGLSSMRHRVTSLGGTWRMSRPEGGGTAIQIALPLANVMDVAPASLTGPQVT